MARAKGIVWDDVPLGSKSDVALAKELGVSSQSVLEQRKRRGIAAFPQRDWDSCGLGERPDTEIAKELGVAPQNVAAQRGRRGIPAFRPVGYRAPTQDEWDSCGLGEKPDSEIARTLGVQRRTVCTARQKRGIPPFVGLVLLQDGIPCRSVYEAMYDAVLHHHRTPHEHEVRFKELGVVADLVVEGTVVEIAGMDGFPRYDERRARKEAIYAEAGIPVIWLTRHYVKDTYKKVPLTIGVRERFCAECKVQTIDLVQGMCRPCRMKSWRSETAITAVCESCGKTYERAVADTKRRFCNRRCYWDSLELGWPSQEEIDRLIAETGNVSEVARLLGVRPATLHQRRLRQRRRAAA